MTIKDMNVKRIDMIDNFFVLVIPDNDGYCKFYIMNDKEPTVLKMFGTLAAKCENDNDILYLAYEGIKSHYNDYLELSDHVYDLIYRDDE